MHAAIAQLELKLASTLKGNKMGILNMLVATGESEITSIA